MSNAKKFVKTQDKETAEEMISQGFNLISETDGMYTFEYNPSLTFDESTGKFFFSNVLCL